MAPEIMEKKKKLKANYQKRRLRSHSTFSPLGSTILSFSLVRSIFTARERLGST